MIIPEAEFLISDVGQLGRVDAEIFIPPKGASALMEATGGRPMEIDIIGKAVRKWQPVQGGWLLELDWERNYSSLIIMKKSIRFTFDSTRKYIATMVMVTPEEMNETWKQTFLGILGAQAELSWAGKLVRKPFFKISPDVERIMGAAPELKATTGLIDELNSDGQLLDLVSRIRPEELKLGLTMLTPTESGMLPEIRQFIENPREINWTIGIEKYLTRGLEFPKLVGFSLNAMDMMLGHAKSFTMRVNSTITKKDS